MNITATPTGPTLQSIADAVNPGDSITVESGQYTGFQQTRSGAPGQDVHWHGLPGAIINSPGPAGGGDGINLEGASHVTIQGFTCVGAARAGIRSVGTAAAHVAGIQIYENACDRNSMWGIFTSYCDGVRIGRNKCSGSLVEHGIYVSHATQSPFVYENEVWNNNQNGIHLNSGVNELIEESIVERNTIWNNGKGGGAGISFDGVVDSEIFCNLLYDNLHEGIVLYRSTSSLPATNNSVRQNIVMMAPTADFYAINLRNGSIDNEVTGNVLGSMLMDADCIPGYLGAGNIVALRDGAVLYLSVDSDVTHLDAAAWCKATGEVDFRVLQESEVFECRRGYFRRLATMRSDG